MDSKLVNYKGDKVLFPGFILFQVVGGLNLSFLIPWKWAKDGAVHVGEDEGPLKTAARKLKRKGALSPTADNIPVGGGQYRTRGGGWAPVRKHWAGGTSIDQKTAGGQTVLKVEQGVGSGWVGRWEQTGGAKRALMEL